MTLDAEKQPTREEPDLTGDSTGALQPMGDSVLTTTLPLEERTPLPPQAVPEEPAILTEIRTVEGLIVAAARRRWQEQALERRRQLFILLCVVLLSFLLWRFFQAIFWVLFGLFVVVVAGVVAVSLAQEWTRRDVEALVNLQQVSEQERRFLRELLPFSRPALLHVAASARAADQRVGNRVALVLGQNRAGGLLGLFLIVLGAVTAGKYLEEKEVVVPWINLLITPSVVLAVVFGLFVLGATVLLAGHSINALPHFAELLERVATLKKNLAEDQKEKEA